MLNWEINVSRAEHVDKLGNIVSAMKMFLNLFAKFCFRNNVSRRGQNGKHRRKHNVTATMFPSLPRATAFIST